MTKIFLTTGAINLQVAISEAIETELVLQNFQEHLPIPHTSEYLIYSDKEMFEEISRKELRKRIEKILSTLTPREEKVIRLRFGLNEGQARTLEDVAKIFGLPNPSTEGKERIRLIEAKALRKLHHPSRSKSIKDFLED